MKNVRPGIDAAFVERQRQYLVRLRADLIAASDASESDEAELKSQRVDNAAEREEDAQALDALERDGNLVLRDVARLQRVDRALEKIEQGTYGLSDKSGDPIARERLQAVPEALYTLTEEQALEQTR
jgi:DnaK suppressor protein